MRRHVPCRERADTAKYQFNGGGVLVAPRPVFSIQGERDDRTPHSIQRRDGPGDTRRAEDSDEPPYDFVSDPWVWCCEFEVKGEGE